MKRLTCLLLAALMLLGAVPSMAEDNFYPDFSTGYFEVSALRERARTWFDGIGFPVSFKLDGVESGTFIDTWQETVEEGADNQGNETRTITRTDPQSGLSIRVEAILYADMPTVEWKVYMHNGGTEDSKQISELRGFDAVLHVTTETPVLRTTKGALGQYLGDDNEDYLPVTYDIAEGKTLTFHPVEGRSTNGAWPYYNLRTGENDGVMFAIGWPGQWIADFTLEDAGNLHIAAGMQYLDTYLRPDEEISNPGYAVTFYDGDVADGQNMWRRQMLAHYTPVNEADENKLVMPVSLGFWGGISADYQIEQLLTNLQAGAKFEALWADTAWFGDHGNGGGTMGQNEWFSWTGDWSTNMDLYPNGLGEIGQVTEENGIRYILWVEPERADISTSFYTEHPKEWFYPGTVQHSTIVNFGNPDVVDWWIDYACGLIDESGLDIWRQDFNIEPLKFWHRNDELHRRGISEIRHTEGLYTFWDAMIAHKPGLFIDDCASGGRRLDYESLKRSVPLWSTDYYCNSSPQCNAEGSQSHQLSMSQWIPLFGSGFGPGNSAQSAYVFRSNLSTAMQVPSTMAFNKAFLENLELANRAKSLLYGDYYVFTEPDPFDNTIWQAYEAYRPDLDKGFIMAFRRRQSEDETQTYLLRGLDPEAVYGFSDGDSKYGSPILMTGEELMTNGFTFKMKQEKSKIYFFERVTEE